MLPVDELRSIIADAVAPRHFYIGNGLELEWEHVPAENIPWEIYKGRLLDSSQTRERRTFEAWNIFGIDEFGRSTEPLLSVKLDAETGEVHVVRAILCYASEAYESSPNVIESRETTKWVRELVGTINPGLQVEWRQLPEKARQDLWLFMLPREVTSLLFHAVVGTSRLPLTSLEGPLPAFSLGRFAYFCRPSRPDSDMEPLAYFPLPSEQDWSAGPLRSWRQLVATRLTERRNSLEVSRLLDFLLRSAPWQELRDLADEFAGRFAEIEHRYWVNLESRLLGRESEPGIHFDDPNLPGRFGLQGLYLNLFNDVALTPDTDFIEKALAFVAILESHGHLKSEDVADVSCHLLRRLGRHLTAYDLVTFHHRGANYPDALLLDALLKTCFRLIEREPKLFEFAWDDDEQTEKLKQLRRRGLRQGWLLRRQYEGHLVPDLPTSPGENARVLPPPHVRVPEEQIHSPAMRRKRLYENDSLDNYRGMHVQRILRQSIADLSQPVELRELGTALFLDRPLGGSKDPTEPDGTPLFSYLAFSRSIAAARLRCLSNDLRMVPDPAEQERLQSALKALKVGGIPVRELVKSVRRSIVSLADSLKAAEDFVILRNTFNTWNEFEVRYYLGQVIKRFSLEDLRFGHSVLLLRDTPPGCEREMMTIYDSEYRKRIELDFDPTKGYMSRGGQEYPASPLRTTRVWEVEAGTDQLRERDLSADPILLQPPCW
jgi:hypothetical protein